MFDHRRFITSAVDLDAAAVSATEYLHGTEEIFLQSRYAWDRGFDEDDVDFSDEDTAADYRELVAEYAWERVSEALSDLCFYVDSEEGQVSAWRALAVSPDFLEVGLHERPIGRYWSFDKGAAEAHWGNFQDGRREIVLYGVVRLEDVDWQTSVVMNAHSNEEKELRLKQTAFVRVLSATWTATSDAEQDFTVDIDIDLPAGKLSDETPEVSMAHAA